MTNDNIRSKILAVSDLYTLPQTLVEVLRVADAPETSAYDLSRIILRDAPVTARLLKMANSAMYGRSGKINTVHQAVVLLGFRSVKSVVLSTAVYDVFGKDDMSLGIDLGQFWLHSLECATTSQLFAAKVSHQPQEEAFVAGLLHDIGLLIMAKIYGPEYGKFIDEQGASNDWMTTEADRFGVDHATAGAILLKHWSFPDPLIEVVEKHHVAFDAELAGQTGTLTQIVALADRIAHHSIEPPGSITTSAITDKRRAMKEIGLNSVDLASVDAWVSGNLASVAAHLDIEIGPPSEIIARANKRLYELYLEMEALVISATKDQKEELAKEILDAICATFSHHINNASTTIMGHSELVELGVTRGRYPDAEGTLLNSMKSIQDAVAVISAVLAELKSLAYFDVVPYHDRAKILNIDDRLKERLEHQRL